MKKFMIVSILFICMIFIGCSKNYTEIENKELITTPYITLTKVGKIYDSSGNRIDIVTDTNGVLYTVCYLYRGWVYQPILNADGTPKNIEDFSKK